VSVPTRTLLQQVTKETHEAGEKEVALDRLRRARERRQVRGSITDEQYAELLYLRREIGAEEFRQAKRAVNIDTALLIRNLSRAQADKLIRLILEE
jgi:hypothetical protein